MKITAKENDTNDILQTFRGVIETFAICHLYRFLSL